MGHHVGTGQPARDEGDEGCDEGGVLIAPVPRVVRTVEFEVKVPVRSSGAPGRMQPMHAPAASAVSGSGNSATHHVTQGVGGEGREEHTLAMHSTSAHRARTRASHTRASGTAQRGA